MQLGLHPGCCGISNVHAQLNLSISHSPKSDIVWAELLALTDCHRHCCELPMVAQPGSALGMLHSDNIQLQCGALKWEIITKNWELPIHGKPEELREGEHHEMLSWCSHEIMRRTGCQRQQASEGVHDTLTGCLEQGLERVKGIK